MGDQVRVDPDELAAFAADLVATAVELERIAAATQLIVAHPAILSATPRAPLAVARAIAHLEHALLGPRGLVALASGYAELAAEVNAQVAAILAAQAGAAALAGADVVAGTAFDLGVRSADLSLVTGRAALDGWIPEYHGRVVEVAAPAAGPLPPAPSLGDLYARVATLAPGEVEVVPVVGPDQVTRYLVLLRGMEPTLNPTVNTPGGAVRASRRRADAYSRSVATAVRRAGVPDGAELMLVGHSQGGITAMNLAGDPEFGGPAGRYRVTHVVTAGSPVANKPIDPRAPTRLLEIENRGDLVPALDGAREPGSRHRLVYRFGRDRRLSRLAVHHDLGTGYLPELARPAFGADPAVAGYLASAAPYLHGRPQPSRRFRLDAGPLHAPRAVRLLHRVFVPPASSRAPGNPLTGPGPLGA